MQYLIREATIINPSASAQGAPHDILIEDGVIQKIAPEISASDATVLASGCFVSPGWFDLYAQFSDPGEEQKEDLLSGQAAAMTGGFTGVLIRPDTHPAIDHKGVVEYVRHKTAAGACDVWPTGAMTQKTAGKALTEMYDLRAAGAPVMGNGEQPLAEVGLLLRALQYVKPFRGAVMYRPLNGMVAQGEVNEGAISVQLGMKGSPRMAEELAVQEALEMAAYTDSHIHLAKISTAGSVALIKAAKAKGVPVTCSVSALHLHDNENVLTTFDENYKVTPPLRAEADRLALWEGIADATVDAIVSDHTPQDVEAKQVEFEYAQPGVSSLPLVFSLLMDAAPQSVTLMQIIAALSHRPRSIAGLSQVDITEGATANLTLFDPAAKRTFTRASWPGKSYNSPFFDKPLPGRVIGVINGSKTFVNP